MKRGLRIAAKGVKMIVPSANQFNAERIMKSQGRTQTADNDINAINSMGMIPQGYRVNHFLTDSDSFYIITDVPNGMKHFERTPLTTSMEGDFDTGNVDTKLEKDTFMACLTLEVSSALKERNLKDFMGPPQNGPIYKTNW